MQVRLVKETVQHNPEFDRKKEVSPENHPLRKLPVGTLITGPEAYKLCFVDDRLAVPHDDEAKAKIAQLFPDGIDPPSATFIIPEASNAASGDAAGGGTAKSGDAVPTIPVRGERVPDSGSAADHA